MSATMPKFAGALNGKHLGRKPTPPERKAKCLPLRPFLDLVGRVVPGTDDYATPAQDALTKMMDNDREGCCVATTVAKMAAVQNANRPAGKVIVATDAEVSKWYHAVGGPQDNGLYIPDALDYMMTKGITIAGKLHKIDGFAVIDTTDNALVDAACHWFGGIHIGVNLTNKQYTHAEDSDVWDIDGTRVVGGHSVPITRRDTDGFTIATWAKQPRITRRLLNSPAWCDEAYVIFGPDWFANGKDLNGVNVDALKSALEAIRNGGVPVIPDDPNPPVPPIPPTPPPAGPGEWKGKGVMQLLGTALTMELQGTFDAATQRGASLDWFAIMGDALSLFSAIRAKDWVAMGSALTKLLSDIGVSLNTAERGELTEALVSAVHLHAFAPAPKSLF